jgi:hypothetical protein
MEIPRLAMRSGEAGYLLFPQALETNVFGHPYSWEIRW